MTTKTKIKFTDEQKDIVRKYLGQRLGCYGVMGYKLELKETPKYTYSYIFIQELDTKNLGLFNHALKKCLFTAEVWCSEHSHFIQCHLNYEHFNGGSNGCDLNIQFMIAQDGQIIEKYK